MGEVKTGAVPLPPEMYRDSFRDMAAIVDGAIAVFGLTKPLAAYYPGSSSDVTLLDLQDVHTIHADNHLSESQLAGFATLGAEAYNVNVHSWRPPSPVDLIVFINATGIDKEAVLANTEIRDGGLVLSFSRSARPYGLQADESLELVGVVVTGEDEGFEIETDQLGAYFELKTFDELDESDRLSVIAEIDAHMARNGFEFEPGSTYGTVYDWWRLDRNRMYADKAGVWYFPYKKEVSGFIYRRAQSIE